ncbi:MAG: sensor histidine kinase [Heteroscytonema crispum UTEX LB 1556]
MNLLEKFYRTIAKVIPARIDPSSLQFRLSVGIIVIFTLALSSFTMWLSWEMKQFLITTHPHPDISYEYTRLLTVIQSLRTMNVVWLAATTLITTLFIRYSLLPLRQMNHVAVTYATNLTPYQVKLNRTPSEVKAIAHTWNELLMQLQFVREQQRHFINDLAHELRTPLSMVYAYLQRTLQRNHNLTDAQKETLEMAVSDAGRMTQILQDLVDLARAGDGAMPLQAQPLLLNDLLADMAQMTEKFEHREILLEDAPFPVRIKADSNQLMQVLNHLINNAVKYSDVGEPISLKLTEADGWAVIQVSDKGCGIPLSEQSRIFEFFYRVDPSRTRSTGGTGLGLSIVKRLVERMGGRVTVQSEPGEGSTFIVKLPTLGV